MWYVILVFLSIVSRSSSYVYQRLADDGGCYAGDYYTDYYYVNFGLAGDRLMYDCAHCPGGYYSVATRSYCMYCGYNKVSPTRSAQLTSCIECGSTQVPSSDRTQCITCPPGAEKVYYPDAPACSDCADGKYSTANVGYCVNCDSNTYSDAYGSTSCKSCPQGYFSSQGSNFCDRCPNGRYGPAAGAECLNCAENTYSNVPSWEAPTSCIPCDAGQYSGARSSACTACHPGQFGQNEGGGCSNCAANTYAHYSGQTVCTACPNGQQSGIAATSCEYCPPGKEGNRDGLAGQGCTDCPPFKYKSWYTSATNSIFCADCPIGYSSGPGATSCSGCPAGYIVSGTNCAPCQGGQTSDGANCIDCATGKFESGGICYDCAIGQYTDQTKQTSCETCPIGFNNGVQGSSLCNPCPTGSYNPGGGWHGQSSYNSDGCLYCPQGYSQSQIAQGDCEPCAGGTYQVSTGGSSCTPCALGRASATLIRISECDLCTITSFADVTGLTECKLCLLGKFGTTTGQTECSDCPGGYYQNTRGRTTCKDCIQGTYSTGAAFLCSDCEPGRYQSVQRATTCIDCPLNTFQDDYGAVACDDCDEGRYTIVKGSDEESDCTACAPGKYLSRDTCVQVTKYIYEYDSTKPLYVRVKNHPYTYQSIVGAAVRLYRGNKVVHSHSIGFVPQARNLDDVHRPILVYSVLPYYPKFPESSHEDVPKSWDIRGGPSCDPPVLSEQNQPYIPRPMIKYSRYVDYGTSMQRDEIFDCEVRTGTRHRPMSCDDVGMEATVLLGEDACCGSETCCYLNTPIAGYDKCEAQTDMIGYEMKCSMCSCFAQQAYGFWDGMHCQTCAEGYGTDQCNVMCATYDGLIDNACNGFGSCMFGSVMGEGEFFYNGNCACGDPPAESGEGVKATLQVDTFQHFIDVQTISENGGSQYHFADDTCARCVEGFGGKNCRQEPTFCLYDGIPDSVPSNVNIHPCRCRFGFSDTVRACCPYGHTLDIKRMSTIQTQFSDYHLPLDIYAGDIRTVESTEGSVQKSEYAFFDGWTTHRCTVHLTTVECEQFAIKLNLEYRDYGRTSYGLPFGCAYNNEQVWYTDDDDSAQNAQGWTSVCKADGWDHVIMTQIDVASDIEFTKNGEFIIGFAEKQVRNISEIRFGLHVGSTTIRTWEYEDQTQLSDLGTFRISVGDTVQYMSYDASYEATCDDVGKTPTVTNICCDTSCCMLIESACDPNVIYTQFLALFPTFAESSEYITQRELMLYYETKDDIRKLLYYMQCALQFGDFDRQNLDSSNAATCYRCSGGVDDWIDEQDVCSSLALICVSPTLCESPDLPRQTLISTQHVKFPMQLVVAMYKGSVSNLRMRQRTQLSFSDPKTRIRPGPWGSPKNYPSQMWCASCPGTQNEPTRMGHYFAYEQEKFNTPSNLDLCDRTFVGIHVTKTLCQSASKTYDYISEYNIIQECLATPSCEGYHWENYKGTLYDSCTGGVPAYTPSDVICESEIRGDVAYGDDYFVFFQTATSNDWDTAQTREQDVITRSCNGDGQCMVPGNEDWTTRDTLPGRPFVLEPFQRAYMSRKIDGVPYATVQMTSRMLFGAMDCKAECDSRAACAAWALKRDCELFTDKLPLQSTALWMWAGHKEEVSYAERHYCSLENKCQVDISGMSETEQRCLYAMDCGDITQCMKCAQGEWEYCGLVPQCDSECCHGYITGPVLMAHTNLARCKDGCDAVPHCGTWEIVNSTCVYYNSTLRSIPSSVGTMGTRDRRQPEKEDLERHAELTSYMYHGPYLYGLRDMGLTSCLTEGAIQLDGTCTHYDGTPSQGSKVSSVDICQSYGPDWYPTFNGTCQNIVTKSTVPGRNGALYDITTNGLNLDDAMCDCDGKGKACNCRSQSTTPFQGMNDQFGCSNHGSCSDHSYKCDCDIDFVWDGQTCTECPYDYYRDVNEEYCSPKCGSTRFGVREVTYTRKNETCQNVNAFSIGQMSLLECAKTVHTNHMGYKDGVCYLYPVEDCKDIQGDMEVYTISYTGTCAPCNGAKHYMEPNGLQIENSLCIDLESTAEPTPAPTTAPTPAPTTEPTTIVVTVAPYNGQNRYYFDGTLYDTFTTSGSLKFDLTQVSAHPFRLSTTDDGIHNGGTEYSTARTSTELLITIDESTPVLFFYCDLHPNMGGRIERG